MKLRKLEYKDIVFLLEWMNEEDITKNFKHDFSQETELTQKKFIDNSFNDENRTYAIVDSDDEYLGSISLKNIDKETKSAEYAICLRKKCHGKNISKIATDKILDIAFNELNLNRIYLYVLSDNIRANKFYNKYGFIYEGEFKQAELIGNHLKDIKWYRLLKSEYEERLKYEKH